ncbi:tol-pal system protein YbgF [Rhodanobacter sp. MP7CTX1]|uniref:tol-pal system protein YbgF n=1 Tax=Rhodanobacter sp. MP7CTX1 TaxID=2723084 RepID=UPI00184F0377|nr:tol-pal system protein YbgF [Rhodanobacter sp. MP7CTX1]MBB6186404.1 tol-pal system protein YbgF [Rhodanobacter sp. MP7CTX1]
MKRLACGFSFTARFSMVGAIASAMLFACVASPVFAQDSRLSLADRVALLEQQAQNKDQSGIGMVNQMQQLQAQVQQLQGQIEELQHNLQELNDKNKAQYADLDGRLGRLEGGNAAGAGAGAAAASPQAANPPAAAAAVVGGNNSSTGQSNPSAASSADPAAAQAAYNVAFKALQAGDYVQASRQFRSFIQQYPNHALTPNAYYWLGESYYVTMNYPVALESFQHLLSQFPQSEKAPDALLKIGYSQLELKQDAAARATLSSVKTKYPGSKAASLAQERLQHIAQPPAN